MPNFVVSIKLVPVGGNYAIYKWGYFRWLPKEQEKDVIRQFQESNTKNELSRLEIHLKADNLENAEIELNNWKELFFSTDGRVVSKYEYGEYTETKTIKGQLFIMVMMDAMKKYQ